MLNKFRSQVAHFISPITNAVSLGNQFLRFGATGGRMGGDWSQVVMSDQDLYTGYGYAVVHNRAASVARVASEQLSTDANGQPQDFEHPYLPLIYNAPSFSEFAFWSQISTYLDLEGVYYLMAIRAADGARKGTIKEFKLLNPYNITRLLDQEKLEVQGYIENRRGFQREIPKDMIIEIRELNPFNEDVPFSMTDAAKESQFTLKTSANYTRNAIKHNINAPGILSTDVILTPENFTNFKSRVNEHTKGEPLFGNGSGAINWTPMNVDLTKAALKDTNEINRDSLFSVAGMSKTMMGIEQSGTTRDTARVQKDLNMENQILPRIQLILDALNLDYRNNYPDEYKSSGAYLVVNNPQETDHAADLTDAQAKTAQFELYNTMLAGGYSPKVASRFVVGEIDADKLGKPKPVEPVAPAVGADGKPVPEEATPPAANMIKKKTIRQK